MSYITRPAVDFTNLLWLKSGPAARDAEIGAGLYWGVD